MDEPNSSLSETDTERLFEVIESLKKRDIAIIYVSHKIEEVLHIADRITTFRDGIYVGTIDAAEATEDTVIKMMVGRELDRSAIAVPENYGAVLLEVKGLTGQGLSPLMYGEGKLSAFPGWLEPVAARSCGPFLEPTRSSRDRFSLRANRSSLNRRGRP
jgi:ribose transport system ATP-binding protein